VEGHLPVKNPRDHADGWIGVDFDGTLAEYHGYKGDDHVGKPIEPMVKKVRQWLREGRDVRLFTARSASPALRRWMVEHLGRSLPITHTKDHKMQALYDDRAVQVKRNLGHTSSGDEDQVWRQE
jgi:hypothetical protein